jgi:hypothetical protein
MRQFSTDEILQGSEVAMKTYDSKQDTRKIIEVDRKPAERAIQAMVPENPFAEVAYEWNNALSIAIEKMWGR